MHPHRAGRGPAVVGRAAKGTSVVIPRIPRDRDESSNGAIVNVALNHQTHVTGLEWPVDDIAVLLVVVREDNVITHTKVMVHLSRGKIGYL